MCNTLLNFGGKIFKTGDDHLILRVVVVVGGLVLSGQITYFNMSSSKKFIYMNT